MPEGGRERDEARPGAARGRGRGPGTSGEDGLIAAYPEPVRRLIGCLAALPGIGRRSAERLAFHLLKSEAGVAEALAQAALDTKRAVRHCQTCWALCDASPCAICRDERRDRSVVLVVEQPKDLIALEQTGLYRGLYHVLLGRLAPLEGVGPDALTIGSLLERVRDGANNPGRVAVAEVIMGLNPTLEGDGTALYLAEQLRALSPGGGGGSAAGGSGGGSGGGVRLSRLARGLPTGSTLEFAQRSVLADAITGRQGL